jgi:hypothetical protein
MRFLVLGLMPAKDRRDMFPLGNVRPHLPRFRQRHRHRFRRLAFPGAGIDAEQAAMSDRGQGRLPHAGISRIQR